MRTLLLLAVALAWHLADARSAGLGALDVVANPRADVGVSVRTDRDPTGNVIPGYRVGDALTLTLTTDRDAYVYLFNVRADGTVALFFPNRHDADHLVRANRPRALPGAGYTLDLEGPTGLDKVLAIASLEPLDLARLLGATHGGSFARADLDELAFTDALMDILTPLDEASWAADTVAFYIADAAQPAAPAFGIVRIESQPHAAAVYVDDVLQGSTPLALYGLPGTYALRLELDAYQSYATTFDLEPNGRVTIEASLLQTPTIGRLALHLDVLGATVHLNGRPFATGDDTSITFADLLAGTYEVTVTAPGHHTRIERVEVEGGRSRDLVLDLAPIVSDTLPAEREAP